jgi:hypothetical protein
MNKNGMPCGCGCEGKPYVVYSDNPKMDTSGMAQRKVRQYKSGGYVYSDKNDPDTRIDMDDIDDEERM